MTALGRRVATALVWLACGAANVPGVVHVSATDRALTFDHDGRVLSTAVICPGFTFDRFGSAGPKLSPDNHWALVDVVGPYTPGNVPRTHALVQVTTGAVVLAPNFPAYLGVPAPLEPIAWASGERSTLAYPDGKSATLLEPPRRAIPALVCTPESAAPAYSAPVPAPSATSFAF